MIPFIPLFGNIAVAEVPLGSRDRFGLKELSLVVASANVFSSPVSKKGSDDVNQQDNLNLPFGAHTLLEGFKVDYRLLEALTAPCEKHGVTAFEVLFAGTAEPDRVEVLSRFKRGLNIPNLSVCVFFAGDMPDPLIPDQADAALKHIVEACEYAKAIGATKVAGPIGHSIGKPGTPDQVTAFLKRAVAATESTGIVLGLEPLRREECMAYNGFDDAIKIVDAVGSPRLGIHFDTFHNHCFGGTPQVTLRAIGQRLVHVHVSGSERMTPGTDKVNWQSVADGLREVGYKGSVVLELFGPDCRKEMPGIVDPNFPSALSVPTSLEVTRWCLERHGIVSPRAA
jgi:D-psicose/D-tagatose/L-ribulose 3-epimerase